MRKSGAKTRAITILLALVAAVFSLLSTTAVYADTSDFGGYSERFKGKGDREPPQCQLEAPASAAEEFFIQWNCADNYCPVDDIRTELWVLRKDATVPRKVTEFLGFPASVQINTGLLEAATIEEGLPASFRLVATDRAGNSTVSPYVTVLSGEDTEASTTCSLQVVTEATASTGSTTGVPSMTVLLSDAPVTVRQNSNESSLEILTTSATTAETCEITTLCENNNKLTFDLTLTDVTSSGTAGTIIISPGSVDSSLTGTSSISGTAITTLNMTGTAVIDETNATVTLTCE